VCVYEFVTFLVGARPQDGRSRRWAVPALALAAGLLLGGCGSSSSEGGRGHGGTGGHDEVPLSVLPSKPSKPMTVQQLASGLGCKANLAGKFADYRQAHCEYQGRNVIMSDFDTAEGLDAWLDHSKYYGGVYLVGERWVITSNTLAEISPLQDKFGGKIEQGDIHGPPPSTPPVNPSK